MDWLDEPDNYANDPDRHLDVPFVPTEEAVVEAMLDLADVGPRDLLYDLGSGDGRIVIAAARDRGARAIGIELDPVRIADAMESAGWAGVECQVDFREEDLFEADFRAADVVTLYLLESVNARLRPRLLAELRPGARIVSHAFDMGAWKADDSMKLGGTTIYKWVVPAKVAGRWRWKRADGKLYRIELRQEYQRVSGRAWLDGKKAQLLQASLCGSHLMLDLHGPGEAEADRYTLNFSRKPRPSIRVRK